MGEVPVIVRANRHSGMWGGSGVRLGSSQPAVPLPPWVPLSKTPYIPAYQRRYCVRVELTGHAQSTWHVGVPRPGAGLTALKRMTLQAVQG